MDTNNSHVNKPSERRAQLQKGYPVRPDATTTPTRPNYRATGSKEVPPMLRNGKTPVRQNAAIGRTYPVMRQQNERPVQTPPPRPTPDPLGDTQEFSVFPPKMETEAPPFPQNEPMPPRPVRTISKKVIVGLAVSVVLLVGLCIAIPIAMRHTDTIPDYNMSEDYTPETDVETGGTGRDEATDTETETDAPVPKFAVTLTFFDRDPITVSTSETTLGALLTLVGYEIQDTDSFPLDLDTLLTEETTIAVDTVTYDTATETIVIPYTSKLTNVGTIPKGQKNIAQAGKNGEKTITYTIKLVNGVETERIVASETITTAPVDEIAEVGVGGTIVGNDGVTYSYSYYRVVSATYYDITGATYLGYNADETVVATDFDYIPAGTKLYVKNDRYDFGVRVAADTGSMIDAWEVDIWLSDSNPQKAAFAKEGYIHDMVIYYLE